MMPVRDQHGQVFKSRMHRRLDHAVGDRPQPVLGPVRAQERDRRRALADDVRYPFHAAGASFVDEPQRLEAHVSCTHQGEPVLLGTAVRALMRQHHSVCVGLQAQGGDQVTPPPAVERDLVDIHRRLVCLDDALFLPLNEGPCRSRIVGARPRDVDDVEGREPLVFRELGVGDDVIRRRDKRAGIAGACESVSDSGQGSYVSYRMSPRARRSEGRTCPPPREAGRAHRRQPGRLPRGSSSRCRAVHRAPPACSRY